MAQSQINSGWHILLCEPSRELNAVAGMTDRGFEASCPCDYIRRRTGRRDIAGRPVLSVEPSPKAMIPGYAFIRSGLTGAEMEVVKRIPGIRGFFKIVTGEGRDAKYAALTDEQISDLREVDRLNLEKFQLSVMPKNKQKPAVDFEQGKAVRFMTKFGTEICGLMEMKKGGGLVKVVADHMSYLVPHHDLQDGKAA